MYKLIKMREEKKEKINENSNGYEEKSDVDLGYSAGFENQKKFWKSDQFFENKIVPEYINTLLAAQFLGVSENALRIKVCRGQVPAYRLGKNLRFRVIELASLFKPKE